LRDERKSGLDDFAFEAERVERTLKAKKSARMSLGPTLSATPLFAQDNVSGFSDALAWVNTTNPGMMNFQPIIAAPLVAPSESRLFAEITRDGPGILSARKETTGPYQGHFAGSRECLPLDYIADPHLTLAVGCPPTPLPMHNDRFTTRWTRNHGASGSSGGRTVRGRQTSGAALKRNAKPKEGGLRF
jgi:hypothetical protein